VEFHDIDFCDQKIYNYREMPRKKGGDCMIITFIGHSSIINRDIIKKKVEGILAEKLPKGEKVLFWCGGYGDFDELCASVCRRIKAERADTEIVYVTPYISPAHQDRMKCYINSKLYDSIIYPPLENVPLKFAISKRNEWMISNADIVVSYVTCSFGGAYKSLQFARRRKKQIIEIFD